MSNLLHCRHAGNSDFHPVGIGMGTRLHLIPTEAYPTLARLEVAANWPRK